MLTTMLTTTYHAITKNDLQTLLDILNQSYQCVGPSVSEQTLIYSSISKLSQLPLGYTDQQKPGEYHLLHNTDCKDFFSITTGAQGVKPWLFKAQEKLWTVSKQDGRIQFNSQLTDDKPLAILGLRACDLAALKLQDQHFLQQQFQDPYYAGHRDNLFIIAVNCHRSTETCFCVSTGDGPEIKEAYDLLLTELEHDFIIQSGSSAGQDVLDVLAQQVTLKTVTEQQALEKQQRLNAAAQQSRALPDRPIAQLLSHRLNHQQWNKIAERCLSCGNCTMVCPSCFCHSEYDEPELDLQTSHHFRQWDSCFTTEHSYIAGFHFRKETRQHYRQWLTHKFAFWHEQYGRSGCTGCGRCISWCPVAIDVTEELAVLCQESSCHVD